MPSYSEVETAIVGQSEQASRAALIRCVGATVFVAGIGEIENVSHAFHPAHEQE
jgi:hypothetical protein